MDDGAILISRLIAAASTSWDKLHVWAYFSTDSIQTFVDLDYFCMRIVLGIVNETQVGNSLIFDFIENSLHMQVRVHKVNRYQSLRLHELAL